MKLSVYDIYDYTILRPIVVIGRTLVDNPLSEIWLRRVYERDFGSRNQEKTQNLSETFGFLLGPPPKRAYYSHTNYNVKIVQKRSFTVPIARANPLK